mgnify:FL=1
MLFRSVGDAVSQGFAALSAAFAKAGAAPSGPPLAHFRPSESDAIFVELGFPVSEGALPGLRAAGLGVGKTPSGQVLSVIHEGGYEGLRQTYDAMLAHMRAQGLTPAADTWESYGGGETVEVRVIWPLVEASFADF